MFQISHLKDLPVTLNRQFFVGGFISFSENLQQLLHCPDHQCLTLSFLSHKDTIMIQPAEVSCDDLSDFLINEISLKQQNESRIGTSISLPHSLSDVIQKSIRWDKLSFSDKIDFFVNELGEVHCSNYKGQWVNGDLTDIKLNIPANEKDIDIELSGTVKIRHDDSAIAKKRTKKPFFANVISGKFHCKIHINYLTRVFLFGLNEDHYIKQSGKEYDFSSVEEIRPPDLKNYKTNDLNKSSAYISIFKNNIVGINYNQEWVSINIPQGGTRCFSMYKSPVVERDKLGLLGDVKKGENYIHFRGIDFDDYLNQTRILGESKIVIEKQDIGGWGNRTEDAYYEYARKKQPSKPISKLEIYFNYNELGVEVSFEAYPDLSYPQQKEDDWLKDKFVIPWNFIALRYPIFQPKVYWK